MAGAVRERARYQRRRKLLDLALRAIVVLDAIVWFAAAALLLLGVWPNRALDAARRGGEGLRSAVTYTLAE